MASKVTLQPPLRGILHQYTPALIAFEYTPKGSNEDAQNLIIFIGGLFDGLMTVNYPTTISNSLNPTDWTLAQVLLSSSYEGWGYSSLAKDAKELGECVNYFRGIKKGKIVLMGHSTGCQDVMEYLTGPGHESRPKIDGGIIQAPCSDREAFNIVLPEESYKESISVAQALVKEGKPDAILPTESVPNFSNPITASRWLSLASPNHDGPDDYFSSDLKVEQLRKTFGKLSKETKFCVLFSGNDEYVDLDVNKEALIKKWIRFAKEGGATVDELASGVVPGASHNLNKDDGKVVQDLVGRVVGFLKGLN